MIDDFYVEATRLRDKYASQLHILIGFEAEWIRPSSRGLVEELLKKHQFDLFVGSVHHMHTIPIDFDSAMYHQARDVAGGTDEKLFEDYFDAQYDMLQALKPPIIGHFDLIRLYSDEPNRSMESYEAVWQKAQRNLKFIAEYGGLLELNSSALRKGMARQYPTTSICKVRHPCSSSDMRMLKLFKEFHRLGGRFCLSDDSHGIEQVGLNYHRVIEGIREANITSLYHVSKGSPAIDTRFPSTTVREVEIKTLEGHKLMASV